MVLEVAFKEVHFQLGLVKVEPVHLAVNADRQQLFTAAQKVFYIRNGGLGRGRKQSLAPGLVDHPDIRRAHKEEKTNINDRDRG